MGFRRRSAGGRFFVALFAALLLLAGAAAFAGCGKKNEPSGTASGADTGSSAGAEDRGSPAESGSSGSSADGAPDQSVGEGISADTSGSGGTVPGSGSAEPGSAESNDSGSAGPESADERDVLPPTEITDPIGYRISQMSLEEKVAQLFFLEASDLIYADGVSQPTEELLDRLRAYPIGGMVFFEENLKSPEQTKEFLRVLAETAEEGGGIPLFFAVDEEGGPVTRISGREAFGIWGVRSQAENGASGDPRNAYETGVQIGAYLRDFGFNVDFAPVADIAYSGGNGSIAARSFGSDPQLVADMIASEVEGLAESGVQPVLKHFPGLGFAPADTHSGNAYSWRHREDIEEELLPFRSGIEAGAQIVMAGHQGYPNITPDAEPASTSHYFLTELLREEMGYTGIILTDSLGMGAIQNRYTSAEAAVAALSAGADMLLMPADFYAAYNGVLQAVADGTVTEERIDESVYRILTVKESL